MNLNEFVWKARIGVESMVLYRPMHRTRRWLGFRKSCAHDLIDFIRNNHDDVLGNACCTSVSQMSQKGT